MFAGNALDDRLTGKTADWFFAVLTLRFALWFYSRVLRAAAVAGRKQRIAWVELGYDAGMSFGLVIWGILGLAVGMVLALLVDAALQLAAGVLDIWAHRVPAAVDQIPQGLEAQADSVKPVDEPLRPEGQDGRVDDPGRPLVDVRGTRPLNYRWYWKMAAAAVLLTVGIQIVAFSASHQLTEQFAPYVIAAFYIGVAAAAVVCRATEARLQWPTGLATIRGRIDGVIMRSMIRPAAILRDGLHDFRLGKSRRQPLDEAVKRQLATGRALPVQFSLVAVLSAVSLGIAIFGVARHGWGTILINGAPLPTKSTLVLSMLGQGETLLLACVGLSALFYEILALALLERIGEEDAVAGVRVVRTYGLMGVGAAVSLWVFGRLGMSPIAWSLAVTGAVLLSIVLVWRRNEIR